jgi:hypothetical protein
MVGKQADHTLASSLMEIMRNPDSVFQRIAICTCISASKVTVVFSTGNGPASICRVVIPLASSSSSPGEDRPAFPTVVFFG